MSDRLLRVKDVCGLLNCTAMHVWRLRFDPAKQHLNFPKSVTLDRFPKWRESEILAWIQKLPSDGREAA